MEEIGVAADALAEVKKDRDRKKRIGEDRTLVEERESSGDRFLSSFGLEIEELEMAREMDKNKMDRVCCCYWREEG